MERRLFLQSATTFSAAFLGGIANSSTLNAEPGTGTVIISTAHFSDHGGWSLDTQFVEQMGGPFLLAHGLGKPVADATTTIEFPSTGQYRLRVRTRNWCPGPWSAPGQFTVLVDGRSTGTAFGAGYSGHWEWQDGGIVEITGRNVHIALHDLTGFEGRCDALLFTRDTDREPPHRMTPGQMFRESFSDGSEPDEEHHADMVIVGGGIAGCAAAIAAGERGVKSALIHERPLFGGNASSEIRVHTEGIVANGGRILNTINTQHWPNGSPEAIQDQGTREAAMAQASNVLPYTGWWMNAVGVDNGKIVFVDAMELSTGKTARFYAPLFIDATGDGWLGYKAGADYRIGRESFSEFGESWDEHGELWSPIEPDGITMGASLLWYSRDAGIESEFPDVPWAMPVAKDQEALQGEWFWEYSAEHMHPIHDSEAIRDHMFRAIYGSFANAKRRKENAALALDWTGYLLGKRESRRLMGDYIYTMRDMTENRHFDDTVAEETRNIDVHYQDVLTGGTYDFLSTALFRNVERYYIPFRCLYSRNITNLMMAGRCFSCSHVGLGGPRVMHTCGQMGIATGYAAAIGLEHDISPRQVGKDRISELLNLIRG